MNGSLPEKRTVDCSIVIPVYNEDQYSFILLPELQGVLNNLHKTYEIILVDDGSSDNTSMIITEAAQQHLEIKLITLRRNFGAQTAAMSAGFDAAVGDVIIPMDGDLQMILMISPNCLNGLMKVMMWSGGGLTGRINIGRAVCLQISRIV